MTYSALKMPGVVLGGGWGFLKSSPVLFILVFAANGRLGICPSAAFRMAGAVSSGSLLCTEDFQELLFALEFFGILVR